MFIWRAYLEQSETLFESHRNPNDNRKPDPLLQVLIHRPNLYYPKVYQKRYWKKNIQFPLEQEKMQPHRHLAKLSIWGRCCKDIVLKLRCCMLYCKMLPKGVILKLNLNSDQFLAFFRQK